MPLPFDPDRDVPDCDPEEFLDAGGEERDPAEPPAGQGAMPERILALDVGNRRIGVAISDPLGILAQPLLTLFRKTPNADLKSLVRLIRRYSISDLVVGDPVHLSGELSPQAQRTREFADTIQQAYPELRLHRLDERLTTAEAHALLDRSGRRVRTRAARLERERTIDQVAAVLLLDAFLSVRAPRLLPPPPDF